MKFQDIPKELTKIILDQIPEPQRISCSLTCKNWFSLKSKPDIYPFIYKALRDRWVCETLAQAGHLSLLQWLKNYGLHLGHHIYPKAAEEGHLELIKWVWDQGVRENSDCGKVCAIAAKKGHFELLKWLISNKFSYSNTLSDYAAVGGHLEIVQWTFDLGCKGINILKAAVKGGNIRILDWLSTQGINDPTWIYFYAVDEGQLQVLKWARMKGCEWPDPFIITLPFRDNLEMFQWSVENGYSPPNHCWKYVYLNILKWGKGKGYLDDSKLEQIRDSCDTDCRDNRDESKKIWDWLKSFYTLIDN